MTHATQLARQLSESDALFRAVADTAPMMIWMSGADGLCDFFNKGWLDFTGRTLEQEMGYGWAEGIHPDDLDGCLTHYVEAFDARHPFTLDYRLRRHDGEYRWILDNGVPRYDAEQHFWGYIGSCVDITGRKRAEENFRLVVEASPSAIVMVNQQGQILLVNALTEKIFGYRSEELVGQSVEMLVPERFRDAHPHHRAGFFAAPEARPIGAGLELFARNKSGEEFPLEIGLNPIHTEEGVLVLCAIVDITERTHHMVELHRQRQELAHSSRVTMLGQFSSALVHELNQPLGAILRNAEAAEMLLRCNSPDLDELRAIVADIQRDDQRAGDIIERLRGLLKRRSLQTQTMPIDKLVNEVERLVRQDAAARRVQLKMHVPSELPPVSVDRVHVQQVLINLINNGMDAMERVTEGDRRVVIRARRQGEHMVEVAVSDSGHGIQQDQLDRVFEPFFTTKPTGMGIGLPMSQTIIEAHGGCLWAENNPERGATFRFTVPIAEESGAS